jgi:dethiobiotin synthetase
MQQANAQHILLTTPAYFVTGTDTAVGKTAVCAGLCLWAQAAGRAWSYCKPAASGGAPGDADFVTALTGRPDRVHVGAQLAAPLAPRFAAEAAGEPLDPARLDAAWGAARGGAPAVVEGAGGLLVPYAAGLDGAGLAARWRLPLVVVVGNKLGCLNHALLTLEAAERRGLAVLGVVFNDLGGDASAARNPDDFAALSTIPILARLRSLRPGEAPSAAWLAAGAAPVS